MSDELLLLKNKHILMFSVRHTEVMIIRFKATFLPESEIKELILSHLHDQYEATASSCLA